MLQPGDRNDKTVFQILKYFFLKKEKNSPKELLVLEADLLILYFNVHTVVGTCPITTGKCCTGRPVTQDADGAPGTVAGLRTGCM